MRLAVQRDDANRVHHFGQQDEVPRRLEDLHVLVVAARGDRRPGIEAQDAAVVGAQVRVGLRILHPERTERNLRPRLALLGELGYAPVRRIDDERRAQRLDDRGAAVHPEVVVGAHVVAGHGRARVLLPQAEVPVELVLLALGRLFGSQERLVAQILGPLERRERPEVPDSLQIRIAPTGARRLLRRRRYGECSQASHRHRECYRHPETRHVTSFLSGIRFGNSRLHIIQHWRRQAGAHAGTGAG